MSRLRETMAFVDVDRDDLARPRPSWRPVIFSIARPRADPRDEPA
jgi:hypothetical protein